MESLARYEPQGCKLVAACSERIVGTAGLHPIAASLRRSHVRMLGIAVLTEWQGQGVGRQLMERMLHWSDRWAGMLRLELMVHADNARAIALYRSLGFVEEGRHRGYALKDGKFVDSISMARLHPEPPQVTSP